MKKRGILITFEGPEGAGKSTHSRRLALWLKARGEKVVLTREPGGTPFGRALRRLILSRRFDHLDPWTELLLYEASRAELISKVIRPALNSGKVVVLDRFQDSTWVYQGWAGGVDLKLVEALGRAVTQGIGPHVTILLDLPSRMGLTRVRKPNRMEAKPLSFHQKVRQGYRTLARRFPRRFRVIRADRPSDWVQQRIRQEVQRVLRQRRRA